MVRGGQFRQMGSHCSPEEVSGQRRSGRTGAAVVGATDNGSGGPTSGGRGGGRRTEGATAGDTAAVTGRKSSRRRDSESSALRRRYRPPSSSEQSQNILSSTISGPGQSCRVDGSGRDRQCPLHCRKLGHSSNYTLSTRSSIHLKINSVHLAPGAHESHTKKMLISFAHHTQNQ